MGIRSLFAASLAFLLLHHGVSAASFDDWTRAASARDPEWLKAYAEWQHWQHARSSTVFADGMTLEFSEQSDRWFDNNGVREQEWTLRMPAPWQNRLSTRIADAQAQLADARLRWQKQQLQLKVWRAAMSVRLSLHEQLYVQAQKTNRLQLAALLEKQWQAGELSQADHELAQMNVLFIEQQASRTLDTLEQARHHLRLLCGEISDADLLEWQPVIAENAPENSLQHDQLNAQWQVHKVQSELANQNLRQIEWGLRYQRQKNDLSADEKLAGIEFVVPLLPDAPNRREQQTLAAAETEARLTLELFHRDLPARLQQTKQQWLHAQQRHTTQQKIVQLLKKQHDYSERAWTAGERRLSEHLRVSEEMHNAQLSALKTESEYLNAYADWLDLAGVTP